MAEFLKSVFIVTLFVSLFLVVIKGAETECVRKEDCYEKLPYLRRIRMICVKGRRTNQLNGTTSWNVSEEQQQEQQANTHNSGCSHLPTT
ncbi:unnamed protein product [Trifolium pratense]|uniref:Uncharacterized protein n=1 Tax=Trifolium pratense TaxID=57577 RepID=A0ACB0LMP5_TRIPR|nr:unnamed protein product [Trifolium pratense]